MRITDVSAHLLQGTQTYGAHSEAEEATDQGDYLLLVCVRTDEGLEAWADVETLGPVGAAVIDGQSMGGAGFRTLREILVGTDPLDIDSRWQDMYLDSAYYGRRGVVMQCISAIDNCLWSIAAQAAGLSLAEMLGGRRRDRLPAYASTLFRSTPEGNAAAARRYRDLGFQGVKFGWGGFGVDPGLDRANLDAIRENLGGQSLMIDPGWYVTINGRAMLREPAAVDKMLDLVADYSPHWVEDIVHPDELETYAIHANRHPEIRFAAGEQQATRWEFERLLATNALSVVQPDLSRCGGLTTALQLAASVGEQCEIVTHSWLTDLLHGYSLHFLASLPTANWVEFNVAQSDLSDGVTQGKMALEPDGTVLIPDGIGIGIDVDAAFIGSHGVMLT
ncbi:mandelate racemase/muconate lactonizing enzyme family protein [Microbacterium sp. NC79]|uniref:mandelate racemase/muconate lactonizing enzyme family protein n=1 Tax=Microbacterium sp. NC79 TaxID=2851009 RepID=UPI001C2C9D57|nr:mandelate racemase/muconate lactonizing enzyme family protein [Microbacterium sp. NC79]MBV0896227.1 mandelate racemase/muconate lactonizing enzyme family protein [Microbacterium sp. NC79]